MKLYLHFTQRKQNYYTKIFSGWECLHQVLQIDDVTIKISALKAIFDQLMAFGIEPFKANKVQILPCEGTEPNSDDEQESAEVEETATAKNVLKLLSDFLDSEVRNNPNPDYQMLFAACVYDLYIDIFHTEV